MAGIVSVAAAGASLLRSGLSWTAFLVLLGLGGAAWGLVAFVGDRIARQSSRRPHAGELASLFVDDETLAWLGMHHSGADLDQIARSSRGRLIGTLEVGPTGLSLHDIAHATAFRLSEIDLPWDSIAAITMEPTRIQSLQVQVELGAISLHFESSGRARMVKLLEDALGSS